MAQLKSTTVTGDLSVSGHVINSTAPTESGHLVNKEYVDSIVTSNTHYFAVVSNNVTAENRWNRFTSDSFDVELGAGKYLINYNCTATAAGTGVITARLTTNGEEVSPNGYSSRVTGACNSGMYTTLNATFVLSVDEMTTYNFYPQMYASSTWVGRGCVMNIIKLTSVRREFLPA